eukprot:m.43930 g.43930  ORF g.43930 m.43930 type:complete len:119 (-) comp6463_c0_seq2:156-512(-)
MLFLIVFFFRCALRVGRRDALSPTCTHTLSCTHLCDIRIMMLRHCFIFLSFNFLSLPFSRLALGSPMISYVIVVRESKSDTRQIGSVTLNNINSLAFYNASADKEVVMTEKTRGGKKK